MRDDFDKQTRDTLAQRVNYHCSNCWSLTSGPQQEPTKAVSIGVGAHITAAAVNGPRYDPQLSSLERKSIQNGIWLCQNCAKLIDSDPQRYSVDLIRQWKARAEERVHQELSHGGISSVTHHQAIPIALFLVRILLPTMSNTTSCMSDALLENRGQQLNHFR